MAQFGYGSVATYNLSGADPINTGDATLQLTSDFDGTLDDGNGAGDTEFTYFEVVDAGAVFAGTLTYLGNLFIATTTGSTTNLYSAQDFFAGLFPPSFNMADLDRGTLPVCFARGTRIATPDGPKCVEALCIGDAILTVEGNAITVQWIGRQTVHKLNAGSGIQPVRIRPGALGDGLPHTDLTVTGDHGMVIDGLVVNASALVNGTTIDWVPMADLPDTVTYYHIETENHDVILANGAPAETFIDSAGRAAFDNHTEYLELYGAERIIPEMDRPRITSARLLPNTLRARIGAACFKDQGLSPRQGAA